MVNFGNRTLWKKIGRATRKYNNKNKTNITMAEYIRQIVTRELKRKR